MFRLCFFCLFYTHTNTHNDNNLHSSRLVLIHSNTHITRLAANNDDSHTPHLKPRLQVNFNRDRHVAGTRLAVRSPLVMPCVFAGSPHQPFERAATIQGHFNHAPSLHSVGGYSTAWIELVEASTVEAHVYFHWMHVLPFAHRRHMTKQLLLNIKDSGGRIPFPQ